MAPECRQQLRPSPSRSPTGGLLTLLWAAACHPHTELVVEPPAQPEAASRALATFEAPPYAFEVAVLHRDAVQAREDVQLFQSDGGSDPFSIRLTKAGRTLDQTLLFQSSCDHSSVRSVEHVRSADRESTGWITDYDTCDTRLAARTIALSSRHIGLLVTQATGHEYRYSRHYLLLAENERLRTVWSFREDTTGLDRAAVSGIPSDQPSRQDLALIHVERSPDDGAVVRINPQRLRFDAQTSVAPSMRPPIEFACTSSSPIPTTGLSSSASGTSPCRGPQV